MAKIFGNLERASLEVLSSAPTVGVTGRVYFDSTLLKAQIDNSVAFRAFLVNDTKCILGNSGTAADNIRLHRGAAGVLQFVSGADATAEGSLSAALNQISARVENYATGSLPAAANAGRLLWDTSLSILKVDTGAAIKQILQADATQVVTNKDIDGGTASNTSRITLPKDTLTNLTALTRKEATLVFDTVSQTVFYDDGITLTQIGTPAKVLAVAYLASNYAPSGDSPIIYDTVLKDTHSAYNNTTGIFTVPTGQDGDYKVSVTVYVNANAGQIIVYLNGSAYAYLTEFPANQQNFGSMIIPNLVAGDELFLGDLTGTNTFAGTGQPYVNYATFEKI